MDRGKRAPTRVRVTAHISTLTGLYGGGGRVRIQPLDLLQDVPQQRKLPPPVVRAGTEGVAAAVAIHGVRLRVEVHPYGMVRVQATRRKRHHTPHQQHHTLHNTTTHGANTSRGARRAKSG